MTSDIDIYDQIFRAARSDVHLYRTKEAGPRRWLNNLDVSKSINKTPLGRVVSSWGDSSLGHPPGPRHPTPQNSTPPLGTPPKPTENVVRGTQDPAALTKSTDEAGKATEARYNALLDRDLRSLDNRIVGSVPSEDVHYVRHGTQPTLPEELAPSPSKGPAPFLNTSPGSSTSSFEGGVSPWAVGAGGVGAAGLAGLAGGGGYLHGKRQAESKGRRDRNVAFGAGTATGLAAPHVYNQVDEAARSLLHKHRSHQ